MTYLLGECEKFGLTGKEEQCSGILQWQAFVRCLLAASDLIPKPTLSV